ncbi:MAG: hypothetical protein LLG01_00520 [Planctomycetaceae bacterium]|nr:hypothetical protein [Planctomycetaceae bacterium]
MYKTPSGASLICHRATPVARAWVANLLVGYAACVAAESALAAMLSRWGAEDFFEAYTVKVVNLGVEDPDADEGVDDDIPV